MLVQLQIPCIVRRMPNNASDFIGPIAIVPPAWGEPGALPDWTFQNDGFCSWERLISATVWIAREDTIEGGRALAGPSTIHIDCQAPLDTAAARSRAAELVAAAELAG